MFSKEDDINKKTFYKTFMVSYSKRGHAKYFGHLELVKIFLRAIRRAGITVQFSEGFHPKPRISFEDPLPIGMESLDECFYILVAGNVKPQFIIDRLNEQLPDGIRVFGCQLAQEKSARKATTSATYMVTKKDGFFDEKALKCFVESPEFIFSRTRRKGKSKRIDLKEMVINIELEESDRLKMTLKAEPGKTVRPFEVLDKIFSLKEEEIKQARVVKHSSLKDGGSALRQ